MKQPEYREGPQALENFERGMKAVFAAPKAGRIIPPKKQQKKAATSRKPKNADRD
jgi:hypothetical protein